MSGPGPERISIPDGLDLYRHQREGIDAVRDGARWSIWLWHRQSGKGLASLCLLASAAFDRPGLYAHVSPTFSLARRNVWDARSPLDGRPYLDLIHPALVVEKNEAELSLVMRTRESGKTSRIELLSAEDPDRLRGPAYAGVVLDEFATYASGAEALHVVRPALAASAGWLLITSTPKGMNHLYETWRNAESFSRQTIGDTRRHDGTPLIPMAHVEQERKECQREEWVRQEFYVEFTAALVSSYYGDLLTRAEAEGRIVDVPHRPERPVMTGWDLGIADATAIIYVQEAGERLHVIHAEDFEGLSLPEILSRTQRHGYVFDPRRQLAPHDIEVRDLSVGVSRRDVAARLGTRFTTVPRSGVAEGIDAARRLFPRLVFDRRRCAKLLQALAEYQKVWDPKGKTFRDAPLHSWASHYADAMRTFALGYREPRDPDQRHPKVNSTVDILNYDHGPRIPRIPDARGGTPAW